MEGPNELADARRPEYDGDSSTSNDDASDNETSSLNEHSMQWIRRNGNLKHATASWWNDEGFFGDDANTVDWVKCGNAFGSNTVLKEMTIRGFGRGMMSHGFGEDPESFSRSSNLVHFCHALSCNRSLEGLTIFACTFDTELTELALQSLAPLFSHNGNLRRIEFVHCTIDFGNMAQLKHLRCKSNSLEVIGLVDTECPPLAKQRVLEALAEQRYLKNISLTGTKVGWGAMHALARVLSAHTSNVHTLDLGRTSMDDEAISFFLKMVANNGKLRTLCLEGLELGALGCRSLSKYLSHSSCALESLDLNSCQLSDSNFILLEMALAENTSLLDLNLANNDAITAGAWREFKFWRYASIPTTIDIGGNRIPRDFVHEFATSNVTLNSLSLSWTGDMGETEIRVISDCLRSSGCALKELFLEAVGVNDVGATMLCSALAHNTCLSILDLAANPIHNWGIFCGLLCETSSPSRTHASNHILESLGLSGYLEAGPSRLKDLLQLNGDSDKVAVARTKILRTHVVHPDGDNIQLLCNMEFKLLPRVLAWLGYVRDDAGFAITYRLLARLPELFFSQNPGMKKRKRA